jgi:hypothetical protein
MNRRMFVTSLGAAGAGKMLSLNTIAEAAEHRAILELQGHGGQGGAQQQKKELKPLPDKPTLVDFFRLRFTSGNHCLQSATRALKMGASEEQVFMCLLHDTALTLLRPDHGFWGHDLYAPYVSERVAWAIKYHQALRFYPDEKTGYVYPEMYDRLFGKGYKPDPYIEAMYKESLGHKWYSYARMITVHDDYSFDPNAAPVIDTFVDIVGRNFKQPKEGLGWDSTPSTHMWRTIMFPNRPL